jgi:hypothetical protein
MHSRNIADCRTSNPNIQGALHFSVGRSRRQLSNQPMGRVIATNSSYLDTAPAVERGSKHICMLGISPRQLRLQSNATGAIGCEVQFHSSLARGKHSVSIRATVSTCLEEHYRTHIVFVKKTRTKQLTDTVFFKHKYITQPTFTTADAIVNANHKLKQAITGIQHSKDDAQMEALERIKQAFDTANNNWQAEVPRVEQTKQIELTQPVPG